jgi:hypothetical protein
MLSTKLVKLPSDIIREIAQYAGIKYRNGKYMVQIPKDDPRYHMLSQIPQKKIFYEPNHSGLRPSLLGGFPQQAKLASENTPHYDPNFMVCVTLSRNDNRDNYIYLDVSTFIWGDEHYINYNLYVVDKKKLCNRRNYHYREINTNSQ